MSDLLSLFPPSSFQTGGAGGAMERIYVYDTDINTASNGGACCLWTVPAGANYATFEIWGGGSAGPGACCCQQPRQSGGAGAYARKTISVAPGDSYTICAAGSTCCSPSCCGVEGFPSYVQTNSNSNGGDAINTCARGGPRSCSGCFSFSSTCNYIGHTCMCGCSSFCNADFGLPAQSGSGRSMWCYRASYQYVPQGPNFGGGLRPGRDFCSSAGTSGCGLINGFASFPGGGGGGANTTGGGYCWGGHGAGGLVIVTFR